MAQIDSRLQPLLAVMNDAGYNWIVGEILDGLGQGRPRSATDNELESVRAKIDQQDENPESVPTGSEFVQLIDGDDQIDFVVKLVKERFQNVPAMLDEARKNLRAISVSSGSSMDEPEIAFQVDDEIRPITSETTAELSEHIGRLNDSILVWAASVRSTTGDAQ
jgi:hypothetical protein